MKKNKILLFITGLVILGGGYYGYTKWYTGGGTPALSTSSIGVVTQEDFIDSIKVNGKARIAHEQKLRFSQGGKVASVLVKAGASVKKGDLLASLDRAEFSQTVSQSEDRVNLARLKLESAQAKIGGLEVEKLQAELQAMETKRAIIQQDLQKLIKNAPLQSEIKHLERTEKASQIKTREAAYTINLSLWQVDNTNKQSLIDKKKLETQKIITSTLQDINTDISDLTTIRNGVNKIFGFDYRTLTNEERSDTPYVAYNVPGLRSAVESAWRDISGPMSDIEKFSISIEGKEYSKENAILVNDLTLTAYTKMLDVVEKTIRALENSDIYDGILSRAEIDTLKNTSITYRTTLLAKIQVKKENKNLFPLLATDTLIAAQVEKDLAERKQTLDTEKLAIEKLKVDITTSVTPRTASGSTIDLDVRRDIETKKQELLELDVSISSKKIDISKQTSGKNDEIISLESELKQASLELEKAITKSEQYEIRAPIDGIVRSVKMLPGDTINTSNNNTDEGTITIEDADAVVVQVKLSQKDIVRIRQNQDVTIRLDAFPDVVFSGTISEVSSSPSENTNGGGDTTYEVQVLFSGGDYSIYSGMSASVEIFISKKDGVLFVPVTAVNTDTTTGETYVQIVTPSGTDEKRVITVGLTNGDKTEVLTGVTVGEQVRTLDFSAEKFQNNMMF